jgi:hypothetical protein
MLVNLSKNFEGHNSATSLETFCQFLVLNTSLLKGTNDLTQFSYPSLLLLLLDQEKGNLIESIQGYNESRHSYYQKTAIPNSKPV